MTARDNQSDKHSIRRALPGDFALLAEIGLRAWHKAALAASAPPQLDAARLAAVETGFAGELAQDGAGALLLETDQVIAGWVMRVPLTNYISNLWVDPDHHRRGFGGQLLDAIMIEILAQGFTTIEIGTHADNHPAIALYRSRGFVIERQALEWSKSFGAAIEKVQMRAQAPDDGV